MSTAEVILASTMLLSIFVYVAWGIAFFLLFKLPTFLLGARRFNRVMSNPKIVDISPKLTVQPGYKGAPCRIGMAVINQDDSIEKSPTILLLSEDKKHIFIIPPNSYILEGLPGMNIATFEFKGILWWKRCFRDRMIELYKFTLL